ncbi:hypothetical protein D039_3278B, partial [Vibrio parahaemolyticus EKP-028]
QVATKQPLVFLRLGLYVELKSAQTQPQCSVPYIFCWPVKTSLQSHKLPTSILRDTRRFQSLF